MFDRSSQIEKKMGFIPKTVVNDDVVLSVLDVLRRLPRRVLMIMKLNDLARYAVLRYKFAVD